MNNSLYEDYMRSVLGYEPMDYGNTYNNMDFMNMQNNMVGYSNFQNEELEQCYPDIYRIVYPMVQNICMKNTRPINRELIDSMTEEIYFAIEDNDITEMREKSDRDKKSTEVKSENRQRVVRNRTLNDLIRILLLRELLGRPSFPGRPPIRPPRPPMRPPMGPGPGPRPPRPGMRNYQQYGFDNSYDMYE